MSLDQLTQDVSNAILNTILNTKDSDTVFSTAAEQLFNTHQLDSIFGGAFDTDSHKKSLDTNAQIAESFTVAANIYANSDYARIALHTLAYLVTYHRLQTGVFASTTEFPAPLITIDELKSNLDDAQWSAIACFFGLSDEGEIDWTQLAVMNKRSDIHRLTNLHPKQVPLALDGALQILQFQLSPPVASSDWDTLSNLYLCRALFVAGIYLNQQEKTEIAEQLLTSLLDHQHHEHDHIWLDVFLLSLRNHWDEDIFSRAIKLYDRLKDQPSGLSSPSHYNLTAIQHLSDIREQTSAFDPLVITDPLAQQYKGTVIISGPAHICRQWLQQMDNQIQYKYRYYAIPNAENIQAQLYPVTGSPRIYTDLDNLYSLQE